MPSAARSSDRNRTLRSTQCGTEPSRKTLSCTLTRPVAPGTRPASARVTTLAPEPICPAMQRIFPRGGGRGRIHVAERTPEHQFDQLVACDVAHLPGGDMLTVAQDGDGVAEIEHFAQAVADIEYRMSPRLERFQHVENACNLGIRQGRGRLVEDQETCVAGEKPCDFDELLLADAERTRGGVGIPIAGAQCL